MPGPRPHVVILAAGASRRFGAPKTLALLGGEPLLARAVRLARSHAGDSFTVILGQDADRLQQALALDPARCRSVAPGVDTDLASSLRTAIESLPHEALGVMIILADQPGIELADLDRLTHAWQNAPERSVAARYAETLGAPCILPRRLFAAATRLSGDQGARALLRRESDVIPIDLPLAALDVDTVADLAIAEATLFTGTTGQRKHRP